MLIVILLAGVLLVAFMSFLDHRQKMAAVDSGLAETVRDLAARNELLAAEQQRLIERVQNLEAIASQDDLDPFPGPRLRLPEDEAALEDDLPGRTGRRVRNAAADSPQI
jgi:hypothetical protein